MLRNERISCSLFSAVREGRLERVTYLVNCYGLSYSAAWSGGYDLLLDAVENQHTEIAKFLLINGAKVNNEYVSPVNTPLHFAAKNGDMEIVTMLVGRNAKINAIGKSGQTPLYDAVLNKKIEVIEFLLYQKADINIGDSNGRTPLHVAVTSGYPKIVEKLVNYGAFVNSVDKNGNAVLHEAADKGNAEITEILLNYGARVNSSCISLWMPLHSACRKGNEAVVKLLLSKGADINVSTTSHLTPLCIAVENGHEIIVKLLLEHKAEANVQAENGKDILYVAVEKKYEKIVKLLLERGANVDAQDRNGKTALRRAVEKGYLRIAGYILKYCPNVDNESNRSCLNIAINGCYDRYEKIIKSLLQYGFTVKPKDISDCKLFHGAVEKGYVKIVKDLLMYGADVNMSNKAILKNGYTLLHNAVQNKQQEITELLIKYGANVNAKDEFGKPPLFYAIQKHDLKISKLLLTNGTNIKDYPDLLHTALKNECKDIVEMLLQHNADMNAKDEFGKPPLFYAIQKNDLNISKLFLTSVTRNVVKDNPDLLHTAVKNECKDIVEMLLQHDADVNAKDSFGTTALHFTALSESDWMFGCHVNKKPDFNIKGEIAKILLQKGANVNARTIQGKTTLHSAAEKGYQKVVEAVLEYHADINAPIESYITPYHISGGEESNAKETKVSERININVKQNDDGITALHMATQKGHKEVVQLLLKYGARIDCRSRGGVTPLHIAAHEGFLKILDILMKCGADVDSRDKYGRTALHIACKEGRANIVEFLLDYGFDINILSKSYRTPLDYAKFDFNILHQLNDYDSGDGFYDDGYDNYHDDDCQHVRTRSYQETVEILQLHVIKMKAANLYVSRRNLQSVNSSSEHLNCFYDDCVEEIRKMGSEKIGCSSVSFYDIITKSVNQLAMYAKNENLVQTLKSCDCKAKFPIYYNMIDNSFKKGQKRQRLWNSSVKSLNFLFGYKLPDLVIRQVFSFVSNKDLENLKMACSNTVVTDTKNELNFPKKIGFMKKVRLS